MRFILGKHLVNNMNIMREDEDKNLFSSSSHPFHTRLLTSTNKSFFSFSNILMVNQNGTKHKRYVCLDNYLLALVDIICDVIYFCGQYIVYT